MRLFFGLLTVAFFILTVVFGVSCGVREYLYNVRVGQYLHLADDASLPGMKRDYLTEYKEAVTKHVRREDARYFFKQERFTRTAQVGNLDSLMKRLEDIQAMTPDSLAYQQGMQQITGQEFDHTMADINNVFHDCYMRESFFGRYAAPVTCFTFGILCIFACSIFIAALTDI